MADENQNKHVDEEKERFDLLSQIEMLKGKIRKELALILEHPRTPTEFRDHPTVKEAVK